MELKNKTVLISGGAGVIGSHLAKKLIEEYQCEVIVIDDLSSGHDCLGDLKEDVYFYHTSILNDDVVEKIFINNQINVIFHLAALFANQKSVDQPKEDLSVNGMGTLKILQYAQKYHVDKVIFTSSSCVYGNKDVEDKEDDYEVNLDTPYAITKLLGEKYCDYFYHHYGVKTVVLRVFNCYGPGENPGKYRNVIPNFFKNALNKRILTIYGTGDETRSYCVTGDTKILMGDSSLKKIKDIKIGEKVISFHKGKNYLSSHIDKVKNITNYYCKDIYELKTELGTIHCNGNHPWYMEKGKFRTTEQIKKYSDKGLKNQRIRYLFNDNIYIEDKNYKIGYVLGSLDGDGYVSFYKYKKGTNYRVGLEVIDKEFADTFYNYAKDFFKGLRKRETRNKKYYLVLSCFKKDYEYYYKKLNLMRDFSNDNFCRGYLAGLYDAEGNFWKWNLSLCNSSSFINDNIRKILSKFKFRWRETQDIRKITKNVTRFLINGGQREKLRFLNLFRPKINRKKEILDNKRIMGELAKVISIKKIKNDRVYNLQVEKNETYIANGHLCHNTFVEDTVAMIIKSAMIEGAVGEIINIGSDIETKTIDLANKINDLCGNKDNLTYIPQRSWDTIKRRKANIEKAKKILGVKPLIGLDEGLRKTCDWFIKHPEVWKDKDYE